MKGNIKDLKIGLKVDMERLKEGLKNCLQEMIPNEEKVLYETHDNHHFIDSNV